VLAGAGELGLSTRADAGHRDSVLGQFPVRVALPGGSPVVEPTNDSAAGLPVGSAVVNTAGGLGGPRGAIRGHERLIRYPDPQDHPEVVEELRHELWAARPAGSVPPVVFAGYARPLLSNDPRHRAALAGQAHGPAALLGRAVDLARSTVAVPLGPAAGRNLAVLGSGAAAGGLLATAARSTADHHPPGTARFLVAAPDPGSRALAEALTAELATRHSAEVVDLPTLLAASATTSGRSSADSADELPTYLVVFGLDRPGPRELPVDRLRALLRDGPPTGRHLLGWWRAVPPFAALFEPAGEVDKLAAVVVLDVPVPQLTAVFGRPVEWQVRPDRAVLWDGPDERGRVLVPFADETG
jgi:DNA segregation ATPase FtsK/SpoIIIE, S-DNA-T family